MQRGWNYKTLVAKYLTREAKGIFDESSEQTRAMYRGLARLSAPELTIFLLVVELGSKAEVARRLGVHRSTIGRIYKRIEEELRSGLENY